ncbi:MAG: rhamnulokinase family protein, partial [Phycisphaerales bacterium]
DFGKLFTEVKAGIIAAVKKSGGNIESIGVDSWGVDFGLIDKSGQLIENPYHYRDGRTDGMMEKAFAMVPKDKIYEETGVQFLQLNTLYQVLAMRYADSGILRKADKILFIADLVTYFLCGKVFSESTIASTSQMMDVRRLEWSKSIFKELRLPIELMADLIAPGTNLGVLKKELQNELGCGPIPIIAVGSHDTASAVAAVPAAEDSWVYISSGTWSLIGVEVSGAIVNNETFEYGFANEVGVGGKTRLLKDLMGMWLIQECFRQWQEEGMKFKYIDIVKMAEKAKSFAAFIDTDDHDLFSPGEMEDKINICLKKTGQKAIHDKGQIVRVILESLAFKYRDVTRQLENVTKRKINVVHIVGGGCQNELLSQFTADAIGCKVVCGPVEATSIGNVIVQAIAAKQIGSLSHARNIIGQSSNLKEYLPINHNNWNKAKSDLEAACKLKMDLNV